MKFFAISLSLFCSFVSFGQNEFHNDNRVFKDTVSEFSLSFTTFNHAERIINGTTTYLLTYNSIRVKKTYFDETKSKTIYSKRLPKSQNFFSVINQIGLDSLKDVYINHCVMATSGDEYFLHFVTNSTTKSISLHHYYLKQLRDMIQIINSSVPQKYQFHYLTKDTKQDCSF